MSPPSQLQVVQEALDTGRFEDARREVLAILDTLEGGDRARGELALLEARARCGEADPEHAARLVERVRGTDFEPAALLALGQALFGCKRYDQAEAHLLAGLERAEGTEHEVVRWKAVAYLGLIRRIRNDSDTAIRLLREASEHLEALGELCEAANRWGVAADVARSRGRWEEALELYDRAARCSRPFPVFHADHLRSRASLFGQRGALDQARALLEQALEHLGERSRTHRNWILNDLADVARAQGRLTEARACLEEALEHWDGGDGSVLRLNLGLILLDQGDRVGALEAVRPVLARRHPLYPLFAHALCAAADDDGQAVDAHVEALDAAGALGSTLVERDLRYLLAAAADRWEGTAPDRSARLRVLEHGQAVGLGSDAGPVEAALCRLRDAGARIPLGPLDLEGPVQAGGMGQVWKGVVHGTDTEVAVKVLAVDRAQDPQVIEALHRELRAACRLHHPHIVPIVDFGEVQRPVEAMTGGSLAAGTPWLATRWAGGGTLEGWCGQRPFPQVREALLQLLDALGAAHAQGLVHLDVKPANVLVAGTEPLVTWLADFGVARALGRDADAPVSGTPSFMAPEQCRGAIRQYGPWTDLYAVGGTAVALVQGRPPFEGSRQELMQQQVGRPVPPLEPVLPVPPGFAAWCRRLLAKAPGSRFRCAADAADALRALGDAPEGPASWVQPHPGDRSSSTFLFDALALPEGWDAPDEAPCRAERTAAIPAAPPADPARHAVPELAWAAHRLLPLQDIPLVGREVERRALWDALRRASEGAGAIALEGPAGTGRTHLLTWLARSAERTGAARVLWVDAAQPEPWRATLATLLRVEDMEAASLERHLGPQLDLHVGPGALGPTEQGLLAQVLLGLDHGREALDPVPLALRMIQAMARERPVLLCLTGPVEGGAALVTRLLDALRDLPVRVVGPSEALPRHEGVERLALGPVGAEALGELVDCLVPVEPRLRARLIKASAGSPARAVWTVRDWLLDRKLVKCPSGLLQLPEGDDLPRSLGEAVQRSVARALARSSLDRRVLELGAVLGPHVQRRQWAEACEEAGLPFAPQRLEGLAEHGLLVERPDGWTFSDRHVRQAVLDRATEQALARWHRAAAAVRSGPLQRARHLVHAGDPTAALTPLREALHRYRDFSLTRRAPLAAEWEETRRLAGVADDHPEVVRATLALWASELPRTDRLPELERRLAQARALGDGDAEAEGWRLHARLTTDPRERLRSAEKAVACARSRQARGASLELLGRALLAVGDAQGAVDRWKEAVSLGEGGARIWLAGVLRQAGRIEEAARWAEVADPMREAYTYPEAVKRLCLLAALVEAQGHHDLAELRLDEAEALGTAASPGTELIALGSRLLPALRHRRGEDVRRIVARLGSLPQIPFVQVVRALFAPMEPGRGDDRSARLAAARAVLLDRPWRVDSEELATMIELAAAMEAWADHATTLAALAAEIRERAAASNPP